MTQRTSRHLNGDSSALASYIGSRETVVELPADATLLWTAANALGARRFETAGRVTVTETGLGRPPDVIGERTVWDNTGTIELQSGQFPVFSGDEAARIVNRGTIIKTGAEGNPASLFEIRPRLINDGVVEISSGTLQARRFEQTPDGTLRFDVRGTRVRTDYGQLSTTALRYSGRLETTFSKGFAPTPGQRFPVMPGFDRSGEFASTALGGLTLDESPRGSIDLVAPASPAPRLGSAFGAPPSPVAAPLVAPLAAPPGSSSLRAEDDRMRLRARGTRVMDMLANDRAPAGTTVRLLGGSKVLRVRLDRRSGRAAGARGPARRWSARRAAALPARRTRRPPLGRRDGACSDRLRRRARDQLLGSLAPSCARSETSSLR